VTVALLGGVGLSAHWPSASATAELLMLAAALTCAVAAGTGRRPLAVVALVAFALPCGWRLGAHAHARAVQRPLRAALHDHLTVGREGEPVLLEARLQEDALPGEDGAVLLLDVERVKLGGTWRPLRGAIRVSVRGVGLPGHAGAWRRGRCITAPALLRVPAAYRNPGVPDADLQLARRGIQLVGSIKSPSLVESCGPGAAWQERVSAVRGTIRAAIETHVGPRDPQSAAIVAAILIGDRVAIADDVEERLRRAGTFHVIAISGGNIAVLTGVLLWTLAGVRAPPRWAALATLTALGAYAAIVVRGASVDRALLAASVYLAAGATGLRAHPLALLASVALGLVLADPFTAFDLGFGLTFGATLGLVAVTPRLLEAGRWTWQQLVGARPLPKPARLVGMSVAATLAAEALVLPIGALGFGRITFAGVVLNLVAIPMMAIAQIAGLVLTGLSLVSDRAAAVAGWIAHAAVTGLVESARLVEVMPWLVRPVPPPSPWVLAGYAVSLGLACLPTVTRRTRLVGVAGALTGALCMTLGWSPARSGVFTRGLPESWVAPADLRVTVLDVGQGDAVLVQFPRGRTMLIDTGGISAASRFDVGRRVVSPALHALGARRIDWLVLTHGDPDHLGGAASMVLDWRPGEIWEGVPVPPHEPLAAVAQLARRAGIPWRQARAHDELEVDGVGLRVWHPGPPDWERQRVRNDDSVVLELRTGQVSILLPGDIGSTTEQRLLGAWRPNRFCVLKAAHHGSAGSSSHHWLTALRPAVVLYSAGRGNWFGHPSPHAVRRAREAGAEVFRTDEDGAIQVIVKDDRVTVATVAGRWWTRRVR
jgi:competence protein ComEC